MICGLLGKTLGHSYSPLIHSYLGEYDYQIFIAKQGETMWDLCKRIKISPENISQYNKDLPLVMNGGEKVIIKR